MLVGGASLGPMRRDGRTYVAVREHPKFGTLVKIGSSRDPVRRCQGLAATLIYDGFPPSAERVLAEKLAEFRPPWVDDRWPFRQDVRPVFKARTEWYFDCEEVWTALDRLQAELSL